MSDDPPDTVTAAPPAVPPKRPRVAAAFPDEEGWEQIRRDCAARAQRLEELALKLEEAQRQTRAALAWFKAQHPPGDVS